MEKKRAKGEMFLKVSGIILILPGILGIIVTFGFTTILVVTAQMIPVAFDMAGRQYAQEGICW